MAAIEKGGAVDKGKVVDLMADLEESLGLPRGDGSCCGTLARYGTCSCPDREQNIGW